MAFKNIKAGVLGSALLLSTASLVSADQTSYVQNAEAAADALQVWYNTGTGLWDTTGWWNSANCLTVLINLMSLDGTVKNDRINVVANTFNNAPPNNPTMVKVQTNEDSVPYKTFYAFPGADKSQPQTPASAMRWSGNQTAASTGHSADKRDSGFLNGYYDDEGWWGLAWVDAYDLTGDATYLSEAETIFNDIAASWPSPCGNGGVWWDRAHTYVNAIANELFFQLAAALANRTSGDDQNTYKTWTQNIWAWFQASGMINSSNTINDGLTSDCANNGGNVWSYNQGVILGALVEYNRFSGDASLISTATNIADAAIAALAPQGILHDSCEPNCGGDGSQFKGVFMRNLQKLQQASPQDRWNSFIQANAQSIWANDMHQEASGTICSVNWAEWVNEGDASTQSSAMDALVAAVAVAT